MADSARCQAGKAATAVTEVVAKLAVASQVGEPARQLYSSIIVIILGLVNLADILLYVQRSGISWVKGSVCFVLKFAFPPFPLPSVVQISKQDTQGTRNK